MMFCGSSPKGPPPMSRCSDKNVSRGMVAPDSSATNAASFRSISRCSFFFLMRSENAPTIISEKDSSSRSCSSSSPSSSGSTRTASFSRPPSTRSEVLSANPFARMIGTVMNGTGRRWSSNVPSMTIMRPCIHSGSCPEPSSNVGASSCSSPTPKISSVPSSLSSSSPSSSSSNVLVCCFPFPLPSSSKSSSSSVVSSAVSTPESIVRPLSDGGCLSNAADEVEPSSLPSATALK
mmetsp:Transcript_25377/g.63539  ORF Transcript_25377/g.63539 Transcript_25377/m.63539 type:complete len:235 (-) Transcript_25377:3908-4612(-)